MTEKLYKLRLFRMPLSQIELNLIFKLVNAHRFFSPSRKAIREIYHSDRNHDLIQRQ